MLTALATPAVESGHVAGWVGVGGPGQGPGGSAEWIQVGLNSLPGTGNKLYYEVVRPGAGVSYAEVATNVAAGRPVRVAVLETAAYPGAWRVWVDGQAVTGPIQLESGNGLTPMAMGESWDGGRPACNRYSYRFQNVSIAAAPGGSWQPARNAAVLQDPGYRVVRRAPASFDASATRPLPAQPAAQPVQQAVAASRAPARRTAASVKSAAAARPVAASAPLRKGAVPAPTLQAILGIAPQPAAPAQPVAAVQPVAAAQPVAPAQPAAPSVATTVVQGSETAPAGDSETSTTTLQAGPADTSIADPALGIGAAGSALLPGQQAETA